MLGKPWAAYLCRDGNHCWMTFIDLVIVEKHFCCDDCAAAKTLYNVLCRSQFRALLNEGRVIHGGYAAKADFMYAVLI